MNLDEMKLAVAEKLPELIDIYSRTPFWKEQGHGLTSIIQPQCTFRSGEIIHWPTEGLQVCNEATKLLAKQGYRCELNNGTDTTWEVMFFKVKHESSDEAVVYVPGDNLCSAWLEALCRVWFPERFK